jgi:hypothetical protein
MTGRCLIPVGRSRKRRNDGRAQLGGRSEDTCVADDVKAGGRNCGCEATEGRERIEQAPGIEPGDTGVRNRVP